MNETDQSFSTLKINISAKDLAALEEMAKRLNISIQDLIQANIEEMLLPQDEAFKQEVDYLLTKNAELYRRLA